MMETFHPDIGAGRAVLVAHPWWGLNQTLRDFAGALAREGFVVGLPDLFAGDRASDPDAAQKLIEKHWEAAPGRIAAALHELAASAGVDRASVAAVGFSFGGFHLLAAMADPATPIRRLVVYYATHPLPQTHAPVLAHLAADDDFESAADMQALTAALGAAGPPNAAYSYPGTKHWFAEANRPEYDADAAALAFGRTVAFLKG